MAPAQSDSGLLGQLARISPDISQLQMRGGVKAWYRLAPALTPEVRCGRSELRTIPGSQWLSFSCSALTVTQSLRLQGYDEQQGLDMLPPRDG